MFDLGKELFRLIAGPWLKIGITALNSWREGVPGNQGKNFIVLDQVDLVQGQDNCLGPFLKLFQ